jgi:2,3-dimethylmalate lyase
VVPLNDMLRRIEVAVDSRRHDDTLIIARTDARTGLGLDEAIKRGQAFAKAGADVVFVESPESADEFRRVGDSIDAFLLANMVPSGRSPEIAKDDLKAMGFDIAIYPSAGMGVVCAALERNYQWLKEHGSTKGSPVPAFDMAQLHELVGFPDVWAFEKKYVETN